MYLDERMFRDKMLGSIRDLSVFGVFRMRFTGKVMGRVLFFRRVGGGFGFLFIVFVWAGVLKL